MAIVINSTTGEIDLDQTTPGTYVVTYTVQGVSSTQEVTVNAADNSTFSYSSNSYDLSNSNPTPTISGTTGGTFSSTTGLVFVDSGTNTGSSTGQINLSSSTAGSYVITYNTPSSNPCPSSSTFSLIISNPFILRVVIPSNNYTFAAGTTGGSGFDYNIDWGDTNKTENITLNTAQSHTYATAGTYYLKIYSNNKDGYNGFNPSTGSAAIQEIVSWGDLKWTSMQRAFHNCSNLTTMPSSFTLPLRAGQDGIRTREAFRGCNLNNVNLDGIKIHQDARYMFFQGIRNIQSFSMDNVEFHDGVDANSAADMFSYFGDQNTSSWASFNLDNWTFNNCPGGMVYNLMGRQYFSFSNEEVSLTNFTFTNVPSGQQLNLSSGSLGISSWAFTRKGATDENFILNISNWTGTTNFDQGVNFFRAFDSVTRLKGLKTNNWDDNTKVYNMQEVCDGASILEYWEGLNKFIAHETVSQNFFYAAFRSARKLLFNSLENSFKPSFFQNITNNFSMSIAFQYFSYNLSQSQVESGYSGQWDFLGSINDKCTGLNTAFQYAIVLGPIDFGSANLSGVSTFNWMLDGVTVYTSPKVDFSGCTIDGSTVVDFQIFRNGGYGLTVDLNSSNINFSGMTSFTFGNPSSGSVPTFILPPTLTFSSTNFTGGVSLTTASWFGPLLSPADYTKLLNAVSTQTSHSNKTIKVGATGYRADPTLPRYNSTSLGPFTDSANYDGGTNNAAVTRESDGYNWTSPPTGGTAASVGKLAVSEHVSGTVNYSFVDAIYTTNNTNDSIATSMDNFTGSNWYWTTNVITNSVGTSINNLISNRGWTIVDGEIGDTYA